MQLAIQESRRSQEPLPCGVVIAKAGEPIAVTFNSQRADRNASAHAEIKAIAEAGARIGDKNLADCVAYCSCEPCVMCLSALTFAKVQHVYFADPLPKTGNGIAITTEQLVAAAPLRMSVQRLTR